MRIFLILRRYSVFIAFAVLQLFALWMFFKFNRLHKAAFMGAASEVTGRVNTEVDKLNDYFHRGEVNRRLHKMNDSLLNLLNSNFVYPDTGMRAVTDTVRFDTTLGIRRYYWRDAKVTYNDINSENNYLQINRGSNNGVRDNMAVLAADGSVIGQVVNVSPNFAAVMTLLHQRSSVSASLKRTGDAGRIRWGGDDHRFVLLEGIGKSVEVKVGDTVLTSKYSFNYPPDKLIGVVAEVKSDPATGFYLLKVRTAVNFANVQYAFVVENLQRDEQVQLQRDTEKKVEQQNRAN